MQYWKARIEQEQFEVAYKNYVSDFFYYQGQGKCLGVRFSDLVKPKKIDTRSGDEIALDVIERAGLKVVK